VPGLSSTTAAGLARRITGAQWLAVETGLAAVTERMLALLPAPRAAALTEGPVTIDLDATDVEACGSRNAAWRITTRASGRAARTWRRGPRRRSCWPLTWGRASMTAPDLLRRALAALPERARAGRRVALRADAGYFAGALARAAHDEHISFAIGAKRIAPLWRLLDGISEDRWRDAMDMGNAQAAVADYRPDWWPASTSLLNRRARLDPGQVSADPRSTGTHDMSGLTPSRAWRGPLAEL
jgi:hypothetical protein